MGQSKNERMLELVELLNKASRSYYQDAQEIMSNYEYDRLYDELQNLEKELGITLSNSPTVNVGYEVLSELPKERHERPMLSLDKTKRGGKTEGILRRAKSIDLLETGWTYGCSDLSERRTCEGSHKRKRSDRRGHYKQCESI